MRKNCAFFSLVSGPSPGHCSCDWSCRPAGTCYHGTEGSQVVPALGVGRDGYSQYSQHFSIIGQKNRPCSYAKETKSASNPWRHAKGLPFLGYEPSFQESNTVLPLTSRRSLLTHLPRLRPSPVVGCRADMDKCQNPFSATQPVWSQERILGVSLQIQSC